MILFALRCAADHRFDGWFPDGAAFDKQSAAGKIACPQCGDRSVAKAPMAPRLPRKGSSDPLAKLAAAQAELLKNSRWVGDQFVNTARAIHAGEAEPEQVHGNATIAQAKSLAEDGVPVAPLPLPVIPPSQVN
jgi:hypothetical protein